MTTFLRRAAPPSEETWPRRVSPCEYADDNDLPRRDVESFHQERGRDRDGVQLIYSYIQIRVPSANETRERTRPLAITRDPNNKATGAKQGVEEI